MITDANLTLSVSQAPTVTAPSTNTVDLGVNRDVGAGDEMHLIVLVKTAVTAAGAPLLITLSTHPAGRFAYEISLIRQKEGKARKD